MAYTNSTDHYHTWHKQRVVDLLHLHPAPVAFLLVRTQLFLHLRENVVHSVYPEYQGIYKGQSAMLLLCKMQGGKQKLPRMTFFMCIVGRE